MRRGLARRHRLGERISQGCLAAASAARHRPAPAAAARPHADLRFDRIAHPWLRTWANDGLGCDCRSGLSIGAARAGIDRGPDPVQRLPGRGRSEIHALADIDRPCWNATWPWVANQPIGHGAKEDAVTAPGDLLPGRSANTAGTDSLPTTAVFFPGDLPARPARLTRRVAEYVMAQVEAPANLDRWPNHEGRLITLILIRCGLRATDACTLPFDCLLHDGQNAPYLRYFNTKMRREAAVPIDEELETEIGAQQQRVLRPLARRITRTCSRAATCNAAGRNPMTHDSYRNMLNSWLATCEVRDEHGRPVHLTPHQWRHTFACRLINRDVPQEVIRVLLDHESTEMTAHYARITDQTVRRHWQEATKVNIKGERVSIDPEGPLAQAQWAKTRYSMATQTLPNGYCGLPLQRTCPHANACLTCPVFLTGPEFLPELREQRRRTLTLIDVSERGGQTRMVEMNQQVLTNLDRMISEVEKTAAEETDSTHAG